MNSDDHRWVTGHDEVHTQFHGTRTVFHVRPGEGAELGALLDRLVTEVKEAEAQLEQAEATVVRLQKLVSGVQRLPRGPQFPG